MNHCLIVYCFAVVRSEHGTALYCLVSGLLKIVETVVVAASVQHRWALDLG